MNQAQRQWRDAQKLFRVSGRDALIEVCKHGRAGVAIVWNHGQGMFEIRIASGFELRPERFWSKAKAKQYFHESIRKARTEAADIVRASESSVSALAIAQVRAAYGKPRTYLAGTVRIVEDRAFFEPFEAQETRPIVDEVWIFEGTPAEAKRAAARRTKFETKREAENQATKEALGTRLGHRIDSAQEMIKALVAIGAVDSE